MATSRTAIETIMSRKLTTKMLIRLHILMILIFRTDLTGQTVQTQIRLLLEEQSDQGLHCLLFHLF